MSYTRWRWRERIKTWLVQEKMQSSAKKGRLKILADGVRVGSGGRSRWGMPEDSEWVMTSNHRTGLTTLCPSIPPPRISITTPARPPPLSQHVPLMGSVIDYLHPPPPAPCCLASWRRMQIRMAEREAEAWNMHSTPRNTEPDSLTVRRKTSQMSALRLVSLCRAACAFLIPFYCQTGPVHHL